MMVQPKLKIPTVLRIRRPPASRPVTSGHHESYDGQAVLGSRAQWDVHTTTSRDAQEGTTTTASRFLLRLRNQNVYLRYRGRRFRACHHLHSA